jgi:hypothetical protein
MTVLVELSRRYRVLRYELASMDEEREYETQRKVWTGQKAGGNQGVIRSSGLCLPMLSVHGVPVGFSDGLPNARLARHLIFDC